MKLIFCTECHDVFRLFEKNRKCKCGKSYGRYVDSLNAQIHGKAIPLGILNSSFVYALRSQPEKGQGERFEAFVIPKDCPTVTNLTDFRKDKLQ